jgi:hypothetical protein
LNTLAPQRLFWPLGIFLDLKRIAFVSSIRRNLISISVLDKCGYNFGIENGIVITYHNFVVVGSSTLCDGLYKINLMLSLSHFFFSALFVNTVVGSKRSRDIETSSML